MRRASNCPPSNWHFEDSLLAGFSASITESALCSDRQTAAVDHRAQQRVERRRTLGQARPARTASLANTRD